MASALEGLKVLDITHMPPGMYCTMFLADFGADVLRIERPVQGASSNKTGGDFAEDIGNAAYSAFNRSKRSMTLNLKAKTACHIIHQLAKDSDVLVEGFRPGVAKRLGIDYDTLKEINPRLIYCSMSGYGQDGPYRDFPGHDINYISFAGAQGMIGQRDGPYVIPVNFVGDWAGASLHSAIGILAAIAARQKTGLGQYIDMSYLDGVLSLMTSFAQEYFMNGTIYHRGDSFISGGFPAYNIYETKDSKHISLGCFEPWFWESLCKTLEMENFIPYQFDKGEKRDEITAHMQKVFLTKPRDEWFDLLISKDIPVAKIYSIDEVFTDPHVLHRQMLVEIDDTARGKTKHVAPAIKLSDTPAIIRTIAPKPGQHTTQVLTELGYTEEKINNLKEEGVLP